MHSCRLRSKQEVAALKAELQKLQLDSKSGAKGKDLLQKEIETAKSVLRVTLPEYLPTCLAPAQRHFYNEAGLIYSTQFPAGTTCSFDS